MKIKFYMRLVTFCASFFLFISTVNAQQTHLAIGIVNGADDAEEATTDQWGPLGWIGLTSSDLELIWDDCPQYVGNLFRDVQIPKGSTIDSAYIQFVCKGGTEDDISIEIYGVDSATVTAITDTPKDISSRAKTTARVTWSPPPWVNEYDALPAQRTPNISSIISEIVAKDGWVAGNNLMIVMTGTEQNAKYRNAYSFESDEITYLHIWYTDGITGSNSIQSTNFRFLTYPNPTNGKLYVKNPSLDQFSYRIFNISGKLVGSRQNITDSRVEINLSDQTKGMYFINLISKEKMETHKIILK